MAYLKLLYGDNPLKPKDSLNLNSSGSTSNNINLQEFAAPPGDINVVWSGLSTRFDGQRRTGSSRGNANLTLTTDFISGSGMAIQNDIDRINRFAERVRLHWEQSAGEKVWLEYGWYDGMEGVPAPAWGQLRQYFELLQIGTPQGPAELHQMVVAGYIENVVASLVAKPYPQGLEQTAGIGTGQLEMTKYGLAVFDAATNKFTNGGFGHPTDWDNDWAASNAALVVQQETIRTRSFGSAARLVNTSGSDYSFRQTLTLSAIPYYLSGYARNLDGSEVTSADLQVVGQNTLRTTNFVNLGDGWYFFWAVYTAAASSSTHGVQVKAGKSVIIDDMMLETAPNSNYPTLRINGEGLGCSWSGTAHDSESSHPVTTLSYATLDELSSVFTVTMWFTPHFQIDVSAGDRYLLEYYVDANNYLVVYWDFGSSHIGMSKRLSGSTASSASDAVALQPFSPIHLAIVQDATEIQLYINGQLDGSFSITSVPLLPTTGTLSLGSAPNVIGTDTNNANSFLDGCRVFRHIMTAAEVSSLYSAELPVKQALRPVGMPLAFWTKDGDNVLDAVNDSSRDNYGVLVGVSGTAEAESRIEFQPSTSSVVTGFWLGRRAVDDPYKPTDAEYFDFSGTSDGGSSGGAYEHIDSAMTLFGKSITNPKPVRGRNAFLARLRIPEGLTIANACPYFRLGSESSSIVPRWVRATQPKAISFSSYFQLAKIGEIDIDWDEDTSTLEEVGIQVQAAKVSSGAASTVHNGLVAYWWGWASNKRIQYDLVGGHHLSDIGGIADGLFGGSEYGITRGDNALAMNGSFSIMCIVTPNTVASSQRICGKWTDASGSCEYVLWLDSSTSKIVFSISPDGTTGSSVAVSTASTVSAFSGYVVVAYHEAGVGLGIQATGMSLATQAHTGGVFKGTTPFSVGANGAGNFKFTGSITDIGIWNRKLTSAEITYFINDIHNYPFSEADCDLDFIQLLPRTHARIYGPMPAWSSGDKVVLRERRAWVLNSSNDQVQALNVEGEDITFVPGKYNYLTWLANDETMQYIITYTATLAIKVTPRWLSAGGMIA